MGVTALLKRLFVEKKRNPYAEGFAAAEDFYRCIEHTAVPDCPYPIQTEAYDDWMEGFDDASREFSVQSRSGDRRNSI